ARLYATWQSRCTFTGCHTPRSGAMPGNGSNALRSTLNRGTGLLAGGAVDAFTGMVRDPLACLAVQVCHVAKGSQRQEVVLHVLHPGLNDAFLLGIGRRARVDAKPI